MLKSMRLAAIAAFVASVSGHAESAFASEELTHTGHLLNITSVFQVDDEVVVFYAVQDLGVGGDAITEFNDRVRMPIPSIAARSARVSESPPAWGDRFKLLYDQRERIDDFDYSWGDGWVNTMLGEVHITAYPWIWHPRLEWLFVSESPATVVAGEIDAMEGRPTLRYNYQRGLAFWFYSENFGWLWMSVFNERIFVRSEGRLMTIEELVALPNEVN